MNLKPGLHPRNKHKNGYNFEVLTKHNKNLASFVTKNSHGTLTIDFSNPKAVKELNLTLLAGLLWNR
jgi:23S rRNA (adenine1618-N6)-methyltransferase